MSPAELSDVERRLRRTYERARLRHALLAFAPMVAVVALAALAGEHAHVALLAGAVLLPLGVFALWYGRDAARGVLPGALGGTFAFTLALCANQMGHLCTGEVCMSWCLPACVAGGTLSGVLVSFLGLKQQRGAAYWLTASGVTLLTGALGCSCIGYAGIAGLAVGFAFALGLGALATLKTRFG